MSLTANVPETIQELYKTVKLSPQDWCENLGFNFGGHGFNYNDSVGQKFYLLKYFPAYLCDYYRQYQMAIRRCPAGDVNVLSVGCGAGIDFIGLKLALQDEKNIGTHSLGSYLGVDLVDWEDRPTEIRFIQNCISLLADSDISFANIIFFPRSITDISDDAIKSFAKKLAISQQRQITIIASYITDDAGDPDRLHGRTKFKNLHDILVDNDWVTEDKPSGYYRLKNNSDNYNIEFPDIFNYPKGVLQDLFKLKSICAPKNKKQRCDSCDPKSIPMMKKKYSAWKLLTYTREQP